MTEDARVIGARCDICRHPLAFRRPGCPVCGASASAASFGPGGVVWASTVVRVPVPGRRPPYGLAYVDLDDGPRILAHVADTTDVIGIGARVRLIDVPEGDVVVEAEA